MKEEFKSGAILKYFDLIDAKKRENKEFWEKQWRIMDEKAKRYEPCKCKYHKQSEEEPDEYRDNLEDR